MTSAHGWKELTLWFSRACSYVCNMTLHEEVMRTSCKIGHENVVWNWLFSKPATSVACTLPCGQLLYRRYSGILWYIWHTLPNWDNFAHYNSSQEPRINFTLGEKLECIIMQPLSLPIITYHFWEKVTLKALTAYWNVCSEVAISDRYLLSQHLLRTSKKGCAEGQVYQCSCTFLRLVVPRDIKLCGLIMRTWIWVRLQL